MFALLAGLGLFGPWWLWGCFLLGFVLMGQWPSYSPFILERTVLVKEVKVQVFHRQVWAGCWEEGWIPEGDWVSSKLSAAHVGGPRAAGAAPAGSLWLVGKCPDISSN